MRYESKFWNRKDKVFSTPKMEQDLSGLRYLHTGVDTVKQLFHCTIRPEILAAINQHMASSSSGNILTYRGVDWLFSKSGKTSGYQYIFKNLDMGFVVLLKSFYVDSDVKGSHLKIEVTPELIDKCTPTGLDLMIVSIAKQFGAELEHAGIAAHICCDFKGYAIPDDFEARLVTHARRNYRHNNISNVEFSLNQTAVIYGSGQSYTFGSAGALQMCLYDKTAQADKVDKLTFWEQVWSETPCAEFPLERSEYQRGDTVQRLEFRFHHSVINEFCNGTFMDDQNTIQIKNFSDLVPHLTGLWQYALNNYRLQHSSTYIDPFWQSLMQDVRIYAPAPLLAYKRSKKKPTGSSRRNVAYWLGNVIKLYSRQSLLPSYVVGRILDASLNDDLGDYFGLAYPDRDLLSVALTDFVESKMEQHRLQGIAA